MSEQGLRIVVFTSASSPYAPLVLQPVFEKYNDHIQAIITVETGRSGLKRIRSVIRQAGIRYTMLKLLLFTSIKIRQRLGKIPTVSSLCKRFGIQHTELASLKSERASEIIRELHPDVLLSVLFEKIFPPEMLNIPSRASLNFHPAPLPRYAGVAPTFWVLSCGENETGVTLHYIDTGIDTGEICSQVTVPIKSRDSVHALYLRCCTAGSQLIIAALDSMMRNRWERARQGEGRTYFASPTKEAYRALRKNGYSLFRMRDIFFPLKP